MVGWRIALWAVIVLAALFFLYLVRSILLPFIIALFLSMLLDPSVRKLRMRGYSRPMSVGLVFTAFLASVVLIAILLAPVVSRQISTFRDKIESVSAGLESERTNRNYFVRWNPRMQVAPPSAANQIDQILNQYQQALESLNLPSSSQGIMEEYIQPHRDEIAKAIQSFFNGLLGIISGLGSQALLLLFTPLFVLLILLDMERFKRRTESWIPPSIRADTVALVQDISQVFIKYLRGVTIVLLWYVAIAGVLLTVLGAPYSFLLAILFALIYLIPYVGAVANFTLLFVVTGLSGKTGHLFINASSPWGFALTISVIYFVAMFIFDQLFYARIVGKSVGLHPVISFFVVFAGAALFGPVGMILAFPVAGSLKIILDRLLTITTKSTESLDLPSVPLRHRVSPSV